MRFQRSHALNLWLIAGQGSSRRQPSRFRGIESNPCSGESTARRSPLIRRTGGVLEKVERLFQARVKVDRALAHVQLPNLSTYLNSAGSHSYMPRPYTGTRTRRMWFRREYLGPRVKLCDNAVWSVLRGGRRRRHDDADESKGGVPRTGMRSAELRGCRVRWEQPS
jgi:hypothetical protein